MGDSEITFKQKSPYFVKNCRINWDDGTEIEAGDSFTLCRCGKSKKQPFCDGSHLSNGFIGECDCSSENRVKSYKNPQITVYFDSFLCRHAEVCVKESPDVFRPKKRPWIELNEFDLEKLKETIQRCPTGALSYSIDGEDVTLCDTEVVIEREGPINIIGDIHVSGDNITIKQKNCSLCRCGKSKKKPFCDGSHSRQV